jgi:hypothetical protein
MLKTLLLRGVDFIYEPDHKIIRTRPEHLTALDPCLIVGEDMQDGFVRMSRITWGRIVLFFNDPPASDMGVWDW